MSLYFEIFGVFPINRPWQQFADSCFLVYPVYSDLESCERSHQCLHACGHLHTTAPLWATGIGACVFSTHPRLLR